MKKNESVKKNVLELLDVLSASRRLVEASCGEECTSVSVSVNLKDEEGNYKQYISNVICKSSEEYDARIALRHMSGLTKKEYIENVPFCHVATYPIEEAGKFKVSFNKEDDGICKAEFSKGYSYLNYFFLKFNKMRNDLIDEGQVVKRDDIYQYLDLVLANEHEEEKETRFQKIKRFISQND